MQPTPLRVNKIAGILESHFVLTLVPFYKAARLMGKALGGGHQRLCDKKSPSIWAYHT